MGSRERLKCDNVRCDDVPTLSKAEHGEVVKLNCSWKCKRKCYRAPNKRTPTLFKRR